MTAAIPVSKSHSPFIYDYFYFVKNNGCCARLDFSACFIYISYLGYIYILGWLIGWIPAVSLADARSFIADDYPIRPTLWLVDDLLYRDILPRSRMGIIYVLTSVDAGNRLEESNWIPQKYIICLLFGCIYIVIYDVLEKINNSLLCVFKYHWA